LIASSSDEELVFDVDEVLAVSDDLTVGILDRMLTNSSVGLFPVDRVTYLGSDQVVAPFGRATSNLAIHTTLLGAMFRVGLLLAILRSMFLAVLFEPALHLLAKVSTSTVSEQPSLALLLTTKAAFAFLFAFKSALLHGSLLSSTASFW
jgi:hypothetical protein